MKITDECINCGTCLEVCPMKAIREGSEKWMDSKGVEQKAISEDHHFIIPEKCVRCRACFNACPIQAIDDEN